MLFLFLIAVCFIDLIVLLFSIFAKKKQTTMIDLDYLNFLENILTDNRKEKFLKVLENRTKHFTVAVEDVFQMHNTSAVMRSCEIFGVQELQVIEQRYGKSIDKEIAMGAQKWVDIHRYDTVSNCIDSLKNQGYQIIATTPHENDCLLENFDISKPSALFFGTERDGLSEDVLKQADGFLKIPMVGFTESLNISVAAAIILQNVTERLRNSEVKWQLSETEKQLKYLNWLEKSIKNFKSKKEQYLENKSI